MLALGLVLVLAGCGDTFITNIFAPEEEIAEDETCPLVYKTLEVIRAGNIYLTNELEIARDPNRGNWDCILVKVVEKWESIANILWLFTHETWECSKCDPFPDLAN